MTTEEEYERLLKQFPEKLHGALNWSKYFQHLVQAGRKTGRTDIEIGNDIRKELRGEIDDRVIRRYLPESMKHMEKRSNVPVESSGHLSASEAEAEHEHEEPKIPPPRQVIEEAQEPEPKQTYSPVRTEIPSETEIILDCRKFDREIRIGLMNNSNLKLYVRENKVMKIL